MDGLGAADWLSEQDSLGRTRWAGLPWLVIRIVQRHVARVAINIVTLSLRKGEWANGQG